MDSCEVLCFSEVTSLYLTIIYFRTAFQCNAFCNLIIYIHNYIIVDIA